MSETFWINVVTMLPATVTAVAALLVSIATFWKTATVAHQINSRMDELLKAKEGQAFTAGGDAERERPRDGPPPAQ